MSNLFYTSPTDIEAVTKALSFDINTIDAAVDTAFDKMPTEVHLKRGTTHYAVDTGTANAYVISKPYTPSGYVDGLQICFRAINTNTGTSGSTIDVNGLGVKSLRRNDGTVVSAGDITVGVPIVAIYSTATGYFHMTGSSSVDAAAAAASAVAAASSASTASTHAGTASTQASNASSSASTASTQASNASTSASNASTSASNAATSESNAATSESNASTSASTATTKASEASSSASTASTHASTATTQASNASTSASNAATSASNASTSETNAAASAVTAALQAAALVGTSTTSLAIAVASKTFTTQASKSFAAGQFILAVSAADSANYMHGQVTSYSGTTLIVDVQDVGGSGTLADWNLSVSGSQGTTGATGAAGSFNVVAAAGTVDAITANYSPDISLADLTVVGFVSTGANTSTTPSFAPDGLTAHTITARGGLALNAGDIGPAGFVAIVEYNLANTRWELLNPIPAASSRTLFWMSI